METVIIVMPPPAVRRVAKGVTRLCVVIANTGKVIKQLWVTSFGQATTTGTSRLDTVKAVPRLRGQTPRLFLLQSVSPAVPLTPMITKAA